MPENQGVKPGEERACRCSSRRPPRWQSTGPCSTSTRTCRLARRRQSPRSRHPRLRRHRMACRADLHQDANHGPGPRVLPAVRRAGDVSRRDAGRAAADRGPLLCGAQGHLGPDARAVRDQVPRRRGRRGERLKDYKQHGGRSWPASAKGFERPMPMYMALKDPSVFDKNFMSKQTRRTSWAWWACVAATLPPSSG